MKITFFHNESGETVTGSGPTFDKAAIDLLTKLDAKFSNPDAFPHIYAGLAQLAENGESFRHWEMSAPDEMFELSITGKDFTPYDEI